MPSQQDRKLAFQVEDLYPSRASIQGVERLCNEDGEVVTGKVVDPEPFIRLLHQVYHSDWLQTALAAPLTFLAGIEAIATLFTDCFRAFRKTKIQIAVLGEVGLGLALGNADRVKPETPSPFTGILNHETALLRLTSWDLQDLGCFACE